jgi:hypothetical protein
MSIYDRFLHAFVLSASNQQPGIVTSSIRSQDMLETRSELLLNFSTATSSWLTLIRSDMIRSRQTSHDMLPDVKMSESKTWYELRWRLILFPCSGLMIGDVNVT